MTTAALKHELAERLDSLAPADQRKVLDLARALAGRKRRGMKGEDLLPFTRGFSEEDLAVMQQAIEEDCEKVDPSEW